MKPSPLSHRKFPAASGAAFTGVCQVPAASGKTGAFKLDCQSHLCAPEMVALVEKRKIVGRIFAGNARQVSRL